jgi:lipoyl-dependent peroxiredoxin
MAINKMASAHWEGGLKNGIGTVSTESGALDDHPYGFSMRFEGVKGTNPEELLGAAHAACFTMAMAKELGDAGLVADSMETTARVTLEQQPDGFGITAVHLTLRARIPDADQATFDKIAQKVKAGCPVSKVLKASISLNATLVP